MRSTAWLTRARLVPANTPAESVRPLNWTYGTSTAMEATIGLAPEAGW